MSGPKPSKEGKMVTPNKNIVFFTDSRGQNMLKPLKDGIKKANLPINIHVEYLRGATIETLTEKAEDFLNNTQMDQAYFFAGVNNLTDKHTNSKVTGKFTEVSNLVEILEDKLDTTRKTLSKYVSKFVLCHVIGLDLHVYNKNQDRSATKEMQNIIDEGLPLINIAIDSINMNSQVKGPWLTDTIHSLINGKRVHKYKRLPDGIHPDKTTCELWARKLVRSFEENL